MEKRRLKAIALLAAAYAALAVGLAYAAPGTITIGTVDLQHVTQLQNQNQNQQLPIDINIGTAVFNAPANAQQPLPDSASITLYHAGYGFIKWADITLTYNTAPTADVTWTVKLFIYDDTDGDGQLSIGDVLTAFSSEATITIAAGQTSGTATVQLYPAVHISQVDIVELAISP